MHDTNIVFFSFSPDKISPRVANRPYGSVCCVHVSFVDHCFRTLPTRPRFVFNRIFGGDYVINHNIRVARNISLARRKPVCPTLVCYARVRLPCEIRQFFCRACLRLVSILLRHITLGIARHRHRRQWNPLLLSQGNRFVTHVTFFFFFTLSCVIIVLLSIIICLENHLTLIDTHGGCINRGWYSHTPDCHFSWNNNVYLKWLCSFYQSYFVLTDFSRFPFVSTKHVFDFI